MPNKRMTVFAECNECGEPFRSLTAELALLKVVDHLKEEHGITEEEIKEGIENGEIIHD